MTFELSHQSTMLLYLSEQGCERGRVLRLKLPEVKGQIFEDQLFGHLNIELLRAV